MGESSSAYEPPTAEEKTPKGPPRWWCPKGDKMVVTSCRPQNSRLTIANGAAAEVEITPLFGHGDDVWYLRCRLLHQYRGITDVNDDDVIRRAFTNEELRRAFRVEPDDGTGPQYTQGKFYRWGNYLAIPGPGFGGQGDSTISIRVTEEMTNDVRRLVTA